MTGPGEDPARPALVPDADWWLEDPELWSLLTFEGNHDEHGRPIDVTLQDRQQVLEDLIRRPGPVNIDFARFLLVQETHSHGHSWGFRHGIELAALLVAGHRQVQDVWLLREAIYRSFDTWGIMPHQLLFAAGVADTLRYANNSHHPQRDLLLENLHEMPDVTDEHVEQLIAGRHRYYAEALDELDGPDHTTPPASQEVPDDIGGCQ